MTYFELIETIFEEGSYVSKRGELIKEIVNVSLELGGYNYIATKSRPFEKTSKYEWAELAWYFSGERQVFFIAPYAKMWDEIKNPDGTANSNYGNLVFYKPTKGNISAFTWALNQLKKRPGNNPSYYPLPGPFAVPLGRKQRLHLHPRPTLYDQR